MSSTSSLAFSRSCLNLCQYFSCSLSTLLCLSFLDCKKYCISINLKWGGSMQILTPLNWLIDGGLTPLSTAMVISLRLEYQVPVSQKNLSTFSCSNLSTMLKSHEIHVNFNRIPFNVGEYPFEVEHIPKSIYLSFFQKPGPVLPQHPTQASSCLPTVLWLSNHWTETIVSERMFAAAGDQSQGVWCALAAASYHLWIWLQLPITFEFEIFGRYLEKKHCSKHCSSYEHKLPSKNILYLTPVSKS